MSVLFTSCQSTKKQSLEQIFTPEKTHALSDVLTHHLQQTYGAWDNTEVRGILKSLLDKLLEADPAYKATIKEIHIEFLKTDVPYVASGFAGTIYVSQGLLKILRYENELMFLLATQLSFLKNGFIEKRYARLAQATSRDYLASSWFEPDGFFDFGVETYLNADRAGIQLERAAKYDPRGSTTFLTHWIELFNKTSDQQWISFGKILPDPNDRLNVAQEEVAKLLPLRDPIIKNRTFEELEARLNK